MTGETDATGPGSEHPDGDVLDDPAGGEPTGHGTRTGPGADSEREGGRRGSVHITRGLLDVLVERAEEAEPEAISLVIGSTPAGAFPEDVGVDDRTPVLTHLYLPAAGRSVSAVFGMDLGTPAGRGRARFLTHPQGPLAVTERDDLAAAVLVAVPPWDSQSVAAFDRSGRRLDVVVVDAEPPVESFEAP
jgi:hypothetical protein